MALRIDKKFLFIIIGTITVAVVVIGGLVFMKTRSDPIRHVRRGEAYMKAGEFKDAHSSFLRAIGKDGFQPAYYDQAMEALLKMTPETQEDADARFGTYLGLLLRKSEIVPSDEAIGPLRQAVAANRATFEGIEQQSGKDAMPAFQRLSQDFESYAELPESDADKAWMLNHVHEHEWRFARLLPESEWEDVQDELVEMVELDPTNAYNQYALLRARLDRAGMNLSGARRTEGERELRQFNKALEQAREVAGDAPEFDFIEFERDYKAYLAGRSEAVPNIDLIKGIPSQYDENDDRWRLKELFIRSFLLTQEQILIENPEFLLEAVGVLAQMRRDIAERLYVFDPEDYRNLLLYVTTRDTDRQDEAILLARELASSPMPTVGINARLYSSAQLQASNFDFKALYGIYSTKKSEYELLLADQATSDAEKARIKDELEEMLAELEASHASFVELVDASGSTNPVIKLQADLDLSHAQEDWDKALGQVNQLVAAGAQLDSAKMLIAADVALRAGDYGAASRFIDSVLSVRPDLRVDPAFGIIRAQIAMSTGEYEKAAQLGSELLASAAPGSDLSPQQIAQLREIVGTSQRRADPSRMQEDLLSGVFSAALRANAIGDAGKQREIYATALAQIDAADASNEADAFERERLIVRLLSAFSVFEATDPEGDAELARRYANRILAIDPDNAIGLLIGEVAGKNRVESLRSVAALSDPEDEQARDERFWFVLQNEVRLLERQIFQSEQDPGAFSSSEIATMKRDLELVSQEAGVVEERINARPEVSASILKYRIDTALAEGDYITADSLLEKLIAIDGENWRTSIIKSGILSAQNDTLAAATVLQEAIAQGQRNSAVLRMYGRRLMELGRVRDGIEALSNAYQDSPGNAQVALDYSTALYRSGNAVDALQVLRRSAAVGRTDSEYLERWLAMEGEIGNSSVALNERVRIWNANPAEIPNAIALGRLLISADVDWRSVLDRRTNRLMFTDRDWVRLPDAERNRHVDSVRQDRARQSDEIFVELMQRPNPSPLVFFGYADTLEERGLRTKALEVLKDQIEGDKASVGDAERAIMAVDVARRHMDVAEFDEAETWIAKAREYQPEGNPVADKALIGLWQSKGNPARLAESVSNVLDKDTSVFGEANREANTRLLVRSLLDARDHESANEIYTDVFQGSEDPRDMMLFAAINIEIAKDLRIKGDLAGADAAFQKASETFLAASEQMPGSIEPPLQLARLHDLQYQWSQDSGDIEQAIEFARMALSKQQSSWLAQELLCILLVRNEQIDAASGALEEYIDRVPSNDDARFMLVRMYESLGNLERAVVLCQEAVDRNPYSVPWNVRLGRYRGEQGRYNDAAMAFKRLYDMTKDKTVGRFYADAKLRRDPPDHQAVLAFARNNVKLIREDPYLSGAYATTLAHAGNSERAFNEFEAAYQRFSEAGESAIGMRQLASWLPRLLRASGNTEDIPTQADTMIATLTKGNPDAGTRLMLAGLWASDEAGGGRSRAIEHLRAISAMDEEKHNLGIQVFSSLGGMLYLEGDCDGALEAFARAASMNPRDVTLLNNLAYTRAVCGGDLEQAMKDIAIASDIDPLNASVMDTLGVIHLKRGELDAADLALRRSVNRRKSPSNLIHLAEVRVEQGNFDDAEVLLTTAGDLSPSSTEQEEISKLIRAIEAKKNAGK